jgi:hypothetical protein
MSHAFSIPAEAIRRVAPFASNDATRPMFNNVCIESCGAASCVVATDGITLGAWHLAPGPDDPTSEVATIPAAQLCVNARAILAIAKGAKVETLHFAPYNGRYLVTARTSYGADISTVAIDADPDSAYYTPWRQAIPRGDAVPVSRLCVGPHLLARFHKKDEKCVSVTFYGDNTAVAVATAEPRFAGLVMPFNIAAHRTFPTFFELTPGAPAETTAEETTAEETTAV